MTRVFPLGSKERTLGFRLAHEIKSENEGEGELLTDEQVRNEVGALILAGRDTSAVALDWVWMLLAERPEVSEKCRAEMAAVCRDQPLAFMHCPELVDLNTMIRESLLMMNLPAIGVFLRRQLRT
jgi:cytochrome P450